MRNVLHRIFCLIIIICHFCALSWAQIRSASFRVYSSMSYFFPGYITLKLYCNNDTTVKEYYGYNPLGAFSTIGTWNVAGDTLTLVPGADISINENDTRIYSCQDDTPETYFSSTCTFLIVDSGNKLIQISDSTQAAGNEDGPEIVYELIGADDRNEIIAY